MNNKYTPAMPVDPEAQGHIACGLTRAGYGLTKREYFAVRAMQSLIGVAPMPNGEIPAAALEYADALLEALENN